MKKNDRVKTFELLLLMAFAVICFYKIIITSDIYQKVATDENTRILCILLWMSLFLSFTFIFIDFSMYSKQYQSLADLSNAAKQDSVARIANRYSIDSIIDEYADKDVPSGMGVAMIELTSLKDVNANFGRIEGNNLIRGFSIILSMASLDECIVGRNGGNRFIILYEEGADLHLEVFLDRLSDKVRDYNANAKNHLMKYEFGTAYAEADGINSITKLIAESSMRLSQKLAAKEEDALRKKLEEMNLTPAAGAVTSTASTEPTTETEVVSATETADDSEDVAVETATDSAEAMAETAAGGASDIAETVTEAVDETSDEADEPAIEKQVIATEESATETAPVATAPSDTSVSASDESDLISNYAEEYVAYEEDEAAQESAKKVESIMYSDEDYAYNDYMNDSNDYSYKYSDYDLSRDSN